MLNTLINWAANIKLLFLREQVSWTDTIFKKVHPSQTLPGVLFKFMLYSPEKEKSYILGERAERIQAFQVPKNGFEPHLLSCLTLDKSLFCFFLNLRFFN